MSFSGNSISIFLLLGLLHFTFGQSNSYIKTNYHLSDGISQSLINCIVQDNTGFLWIGTQEGLNRFDGYTFEVYKHNPADPFSLSNNNISDIYIDKDDNLWLATNGGGLNKFEKSENKFFHFNLNTNLLKKEAGLMVTKIIPSGENILYLGSLKYGLLEFDIGKKTLMKISPFLNSTPQNNISSLLTINKNFLLLGTAAGLYAFNKTSKIISPFMHNKFGTKKITALYKLKGNKILIGTFQGRVYILSLDTRHPANINCQSEEIANFHFPINVIAGHSAENILIGTDNFLALYNLRDIKSTGLKTAQLKIIDRFDLRTNSTFIDRSGILWIGTSNRGLFKYAPKHKNFYTLEFPLTNRSVWSIYEENDKTIWIGTDGNGIMKINNETGEVKKWKNIPGDKTSLSNNNVKSIIKDRRGNYWFTTFGGGLNMLKQNGKFKRFMHREDDSKTISHNSIWAITEDNDGDIWIGTRNGLDCLTYPDRKIVHYKHDPDNPTSISNNSVLYVYQDKEGVFWIGTYGGGLNRFDKSKGVFTHYLHNNNDTTTISDNSVMSICEDSKGRLWIGCDIGMNMFDKKTGAFKRFYEKNGLPDNVVYGVIADSQDNIWLSTNKGIARYIPSKKIFDYYDYRDGLQSNEFNEGAYFYSNTGRIYFGGINGINYFRPSDISNNPHPPKIVIEKVKVMNSEFPLNSYESEDAIIELGYNDNFLQIEFAGLEFTDPVKNQYKYKLEGFDEKWNFAGNRRLAIYTNLDPGEYNFKVSASNNDGVWSTGHAKLKISISPPYWDTWWFRISVALLILAMFYYLHRLKILKIKEVEKLRLKIASDLHDEVGASLTSLSINAQLLNNGNSDKTKKERIKKIENLSRNVITTMGDIVWSIDSRNDSLQNLINRMKDLSFQILNDKDIPVNYDIHIKSPDKKISVDTRQNIYLIFKEAINNIAKHSTADRVEIKIKQVMDHFEMEVVDNGIGFNESMNNNGNGLKNMQLRAERMNGQLNIVSNGGLKIKLNLQKI